MTAKVRTITKDGATIHRCKTCGKDFKGTGKRGRPFDDCPDCRKDK